MRLLTVYIADDQELSRQGLKTMLRKMNGLRIAGEARDGGALLDLVRKEPPDAVLLDLKMPVLNGIETALILMEEFPLVGVVALSNYDEDYWVEAVLEAGIRGYVLKGADKHEMLSALVAVHSGGEYFCPGIREKIIRLRRARQSAEKAAAGFTRRELEVIQLICAGYTSNMIAEALNISPRTVNIFRTNVYRKAGVHNSAGFVSYARDHGLYRGSFEGRREESKG